jgi:hypothetical protein
MQKITLYTADRAKPITMDVVRVVGGITANTLKDIIDFEDEAGNKGWLYINKEAIIAVVISPIKDDSS